MFQVMGQFSRTTRYKPENSDQEYTTVILQEMGAEYRVAINGQTTPDNVSALVPGKWYAVPAEVSASSYQGQARLKIRAAGNFQEVNRR